ncbi:MAG: glycosyltransferase [Desulfotomaculaceae bacterium]|nr:glycosyltransferase [Desulfotomaculaceae bacterium]
MQKEIKPCFISSYVPRECGIATFTHNLYTSYQNQYASAGKVVAVDGLPPVYYPGEVDFVFDKNKMSDYTAAARHINTNDLQVVNLQHEFGLFGGPEGRHIARLLERLKKPVVATIHTVLQQPTLGYYTSLIEVVQRSQRVVVMSNKAIEILREVYYVPPEKIVMIPHGVPDLPFVETEPFKKELGLAGRFVLLSFGLLSPGKGFELVLEALPEVVRKHPDLLYVILGKTHPEVARVHGERYRESLQKLTHEYKLENNVLFIDRFVTNEELYNYISASDVYVTPYHSQDQITSGTLAYAVALGKVVVSTPYHYAQEVLAEDRGYLVPFNNPKALTRTLSGILSNKEDMPKTRCAAYEYGRTMIWSRVAELYHGLFKEVCKEFSLNKLQKISVVYKSSQEYLRRRNLHTMIERLTDDTGIFQHTKYGVPDLKHGYSADDVGRALGIIMKLARYDKEPGYFQLAKKYLAFILYVQKENGRFHNFVGYDRRILDEDGGDDTFGRVLIGLGSAVLLSPDPSVTSLAKEIFDRAIAGRQPDLPLSTCPKALAYSICGLADYLKKYPDVPEVEELLRVGADYLVKLYKDNKRPGWEWFEPSVTYANAKLPYALMMAYSIFKEEIYLSTALVTLNFLTGVQYNGTYFDIVGNKCWLVYGGEKASFDQQPIEIGCLVEAYCEALRQTHDENYRKLANRAFNWFFGNNSREEPVYNLKDDYPLDGLTETGVNENSGAESVLAFALAITSLKDISKRKTLGRRTGPAKAKKNPSID